MSGSAPREGRRRILHLLVGSIIAACCHALPGRTVSLLFAALLLMLVTLELARHRAPALQQALLRLAAGAVRPAEERGIAGGTILVFGFALTWWAFPAALATRAILVAATADPAASALGTLAAPRGRKTLTGSAAALAVALAVLVATGIPWRVAIPGAVAAALLERLPGRAVDNIAVPVGTAAVLTVLR